MKGFEGTKGVKGGQEWLKGTRQEKRGQWVLMWHIGGQWESTGANGVQTGVN